MAFLGNLALLCFVRSCFVVCAAISLCFYDENPDLMKSCIVRCLGWSEVLNIAFFRAFLRRWHSSYHQ